MTLAALGFGPIEELIYRSMVGNPAISVDELAEQHHLTAAEVQRTFRALVEFGVLKPDPGGNGYLVPQPAAAIGQLIERREDDLLRQYRRASESRSVIDEFELLYRQVGKPESENYGVERLENLDEVRDRLEELSFFTRSSVYSIQPGGPQSKESIEASRPLDQRGIRRGVDMRVIHQVTVLDDELNRAYLRELVMGGAQVRVTSQQVDRMIIMDGKVAMIPLDPANSRRGALIVRHPGLLSGFVDLFNRAWHDASELPWLAEGREQPAAPEITLQEKRILELLASGCTDETSAREVGVSVRHLRRTISRLMRLLGANSRFEAGVEAARRGWL